MSQWGEQIPEYIAMPVNILGTTVFQSRGEPRTTVISMVVISAGDDCIRSFRLSDPIFGYCYLVFLRTALLQIRQEMFPTLTSRGQVCGDSGPIWLHRPSMLSCGNLQGVMMANADESRQLPPAGRHR